MDYKTPSSRYIPLSSTNTQLPVVLIDSKAPLKDLHAFADLRFRQATQFLDSLAHMRPGEVDDRDLSAMAAQAHALMQEGCDVNQVIERRLAQQP
ncbi:hypothetical protein [Pseudomonas sp. TE3610]